MPRRLSKAHIKMERGKKKKSIAIVVSTLRNLNGEKKKKNFLLLMDFWKSLEINTKTSAISIQQTLRIDILGHSSKSVTLLCKVCI